jgi:hypothetical protein
MRLFQKIYKLDSEGEYLMKKYFLYTNERFPLIPALILAMVVYYASYFWGGFIVHDNPIEPLKSIAGFFVIFLIMFHIRIFDEHKDYERDIVAYPERLLSRGIVTLKDLRKLLAFILVLEAVLSIYLGIAQFVIWLAIFVYTVLMLKDFFIPEFLDRHMGLYILSHQISVPMMLSLGFSQRSPQLDNPMPLLLLFTAAMLASITFEISRKIWPEEREHELADSYSKSWGRGHAVIINQIIAITSTCLMTYVYLSTGRGLIPTIVQSSLFMLFLAAGIIFIKKPAIKTSKALEGMGALFVLGFFANAAISFYIITQGK